MIKSVDASARREICPGVAGARPRHRGVQEGHRSHADPREPEADASRAAREAAVVHGSVSRIARRGAAPGVKSDFSTLLRTLSHGGVDFILVGGLAAAAQGAARATYDVDVLYARGLDNLKRLVDALVPLEPYL